MDSQRDLEKLNKVLEGICMNFEMQFLGTRGFKCFVQQRQYGSRVVLQVWNGPDDMKLQTLVRVKSPDDIPFVKQVLSCLKDVIYRELEWNSWKKIDQHSDFLTSNAEKQASVLDQNDAPKPVSGTEEFQNDPLVISKGIICEPHQDSEADVTIGAEPIDTGAKLSQNESEPDQDEANDTVMVSGAEVSEVLPDSFVCSKRKVSEAELDEANVSGDRSKLSEKHSDSVTSKRNKNEAHCDPDDTLDLQLHIDSD